MEPLIKSAELNLGNLIWDTHKLNERFKFMGVPNWHKFMGVPNWHKFMGVPNWH